MNFMSLVRSEQKKEITDLSKDQLAGDNGRGGLAGLGGGAFRHLLNTRLQNRLNMLLPMGLSEPFIVSDYQIGACPN